ncbi:MAG: cyclodeaminase/cyclohydrolase family protein [Thermomicrobiales bacterium]
MSERTLQEYLDATASTAPAPGAGSVAAIAGAMGAALGEMVCGITLKSENSDGLADLEIALSELGESRVRLMELSPLDEAAYLAFRGAQTLPRTTPTEKSARRQAMQSALLAAAEVPLEIAERAVQALTVMVGVARFGSIHTLADVATAAHLLSASILGAMENVLVNIRLIKDEQEVARLSLRSDAVQHERSRSFDAVMAAISLRQDQ